MLHTDRVCCSDDGSSNWLRRPFGFRAVAKVAMNVAADLIVFFTAVPPTSVDDILTNTREHEAVSG